MQFFVFLHSFSTFRLSFTSLPRIPLGYVSTVILGLGVPPKIHHLESLRNRKSKTLLASPYLEINFLPGYEQTEKLFLSILLINELHWHADEDTVSSQYDALMSPELDQHY